MCVCVCVCLCDHASPMPTLRVLLCVMLLCTWHTTQAVHVHAYAHSCMGGSTYLPPWQASLVSYCMPVALRMEIGFAFCGPSPTTHHLGVYPFDVALLVPTASGGGARARFYLEKYFWGRSILQCNEYNRSTHCVVVWGNIPRNISDFEVTFDLI